MKSVNILKSLIILSVFVYIILIGKLNIKANDNSIINSLYEKTLVYDVNTNEPNGGFLMDDKIDSLEKALKAIYIEPDEKKNYERVATLYSKEGYKGIKVFVEGVDVDFSKYSDVNPLLESGRTLIPIRAVAEAFGAKVGWSKEDRKVSIYLDGVNMDLKIDSDLANVNGNMLKLDVAAKIINGRTMVPIRFIGESFSLNVNWLPNSNGVNIVYILS